MMGPKETAAVVTAKEKERKVYAPAPECSFNCQIMHAIFRTALVRCFKALASAATALAVHAFPLQHPPLVAHC